jgi:hypothetical protein
VLERDGGEELEFLVDEVGRSRPIDGPDQGFCLYAAAAGLQALVRWVLEAPRRFGIVDRAKPVAGPGEVIVRIAATAVFCFITAWNEYAFALMMTNRKAQTAPPYIPSQLGSGVTDWTVIAAGTFLFLVPVAVFTFLLRRHLLRGVTFGAIRK